MGGGPRRRKQHGSGDGRQEWREVKENLVTAQNTGQRRHTILRGHASVPGFAIHDWLLSISYRAEAVGLVLAVNGLKVCIIHLNCR